MDQTRLLAMLRSADQAVSIHRANEQACRDVTGLYAIFVDSADNLPDPYRHRLLQNATTLIYVGKAGTCLHTRLVLQDLQHRNPATFFRGLGAILGYRPPRGSLKHANKTNNYKFSLNDTSRIIKWIDEHLRILCVPMMCEEIVKWEKIAIRELRPLLNSTHNPDRTPELAALREECRRIAAG